MKIRTTLTLQYAGITAAVFFAFVIAVYYVSEHSRSNAFFRNLQSEAITKAHLFLNNQVDAKTMQSIYLNNQKFINEVEVAVYTTDFKILYHDALQNDIVKETPEMVKRILKRKNISFYVDEYQAIGLVYPFEGQYYIVTAAAYDGYGYANRDALRNMLILLFIGDCRLYPLPKHLKAHTQYRERSGENHRLTYRQKTACKKRTGRTGRTEYYIQCTAGTFGEVLQLTKDVCQQCIS